ncbi:hypothetical protein [Methylobacterium aquaticum]|uniref:hypothetical protein n=1 Tax=Methylobacterium aquaticum TaxID=270351 RepID=UPI0019320019|nr:hypothetical protein [Methylobacterium aquaticum]QRE77392.1 hypothetical protein F1D61_31140 [Methylobacterium aquaticum]
MSAVYLQPVTSPGLAHYERLLDLTGTQYRLDDGTHGVGVVLGMLDTRTGRLPIGLVDARRAYWDDTLFYDANRRCLAVVAPDRWAAFVGTYAGGGWLLGLVGGLGGFALMTVAALGSVVLDIFRFAVFPAMLLGLVGLLVYGLIGYAVIMTALQALPYLLGGIVAWLGLCGLIALERHARCRRTGCAIETLLERQLMPIFG